MDAVEEEYRKLTTAQLVGSGLRIEDKPKRRKCRGCERRRMVAKRRLNTAFENDESNWLTSCQECYEAEIQHYNDLWDDYYATCC